MQQGRRLVAGTSLVEVLVVIVVFLVGILAVIQIYPGGFKILNNTRSLSIANSLAHDLGEKLKGDADELPDAILPVGVPATLGGFGAADGTRTIDDPSIYNEANAVLNFDGTLTYPGLGITFPNYNLYAGANVYRRIIGEGIKIPSPTSVGNYFGGLALLKFGPVRQTAWDFFPISVYSTDYQISEGQAPTTAYGPGQAYVDDPNSSAGNLIFFAENDFTNNAPAPKFKISMMAYVQAAGVVQPYPLNNVNITVSATTANVPIPAGSTTSPYRWYSIPISSLLPPGVSYISCDLNSIHLQRFFNQVAPNAFSNFDPYQVNLFNSPTGVLLFNPLGYNYTVLAPSGSRLPLRAKVDYEVLDWRIIHDDIRLGNGEAEYRLTLSNLKVLNQPGSDNLVYRGLGVLMPDYNLNLRTTDVMFQDVATGGIFLYSPENVRDSSPPLSLASNDIWLDPTQSSFFVDKSSGTFKMVDYNRSTVSGPGLQIMLAMPDPLAPGGYDPPVPVNAEGRTIRVYYCARNEWTAFPRIAQGLYQPVGLTLTNLTPAGQYRTSVGTRIYFSASDIGNKVTFDQIYYHYTNSLGTQVVANLENQSFVVQNGNDVNGPYVDISTAASGAAQSQSNPAYQPNGAPGYALDFSHGYAVQGVHGTSVSSRVLFNPDSYHLGATATNTGIFDQFTQSWRRTIVDTILQRGGNNATPSN